MISNTFTCCGSPFVDKLQGDLNQAQRLPVLGTLPSILKALVSTAETVVGLAGHILLSLACLFLEKKESWEDSRVYSWCREKNVLCARMFYAGFVQLLYALGNICSLGFLAYKLQSTSPFSSYSHRHYPPLEAF